MEPDHRPVWSSWGLLPGFSASRLLYDMPYDRLLGMDVDSGLKISGVMGAVDYGLSVTQGYGPHNTPQDIGHGLAVGRVGFTPGDTDEISLGLSAAWGRSLISHDEDASDMVGMNKDREVLRALGGVDATLYLGRFLGRIEVATGRVDHQPLATTFAALVYHERRISLCRRKRCTSYGHASGLSFVFLVLLARFPLPPRMFTFAYGETPSAP
ncbi:MAG: hypothetical protein FP816_04420 [Desulfobacteraceae bacterium]|nr:hypothetical protein [Desulfobacteraceae bacterium]MBU4055508.1 hypothetical protein [Pseudomonadota bacterium]